MKRLQPPTILHLVLLGFFIVLLPLIVSLARGYETLGRMALLYETDTSRMVQLCEESQQLEANLIGMERYARQYKILKDRHYLEMFEQRLDIMTSLVASLLSLEEARLLPPLRMFQNELTALSKLISSESVQDLDYDKGLARFETLFSLAGSLKTEVSDYLQSRVSFAKKSAEDVSQEMMVYTLTLIPLTIILIVFFAFQIMGPLQKISNIISLLGKGEYKQDYKVKGSRDLQKVVRQLSWLGEQLQSSEQEKTRFLRHISHELKTPLSTIKEGTELLYDEIPGHLTPQQQEVVGIQRQAIDSFQGLINNLLDFNLLKRKPSMYLVNSPIQEIVADILASYSLTAKRKHISLKVMGKPMLVRIDQSILKAAIDNLISNAIHFTPEKGSVEVTWRAGSYRSLLINVKDTGPGIAEDEQEKIFLPFYQGKARKKGSLKGTGLGLSVARECAESHGGHLRMIHSKIGAHFQIYLPNVVVDRTRINEKTFVSQLNH